MKTMPPDDADAESIIRDLHRVRASILEQFGNDLHKLAEDARQRQALSGCRIWQGKSKVDTDASDA